MSPSDKQRAQWEQATRHTYDYKVARELLEAGYPVDDPCSENDQTSFAFETALVHAIASKDLTMVRLLLEFGANPNRIDAMESSPLSYCCLGPCSVPMLELLMDFGADPNLPSGYDESPILFLVSNKQKADAMECLLARGADINQATRKGETPLMAVCAVRADPLIEYLVARGADSRPLDCKGRSALDRYQSGPLKQWLETTMQVHEIQADTPASTHSNPSRRI